MTGDEKTSGSGPPNQTESLFLAMANPSAHAPLLATDLATTFPCLLYAHDELRSAD